MVAGPAGGYHPAGPHGATRVLTGPGRPTGTDEFEAIDRPTGRPHRRAERTVGIVVLALVLVGAAVSAGLVLSKSGSGHQSNTAGGTASVPAGSPLSVTAVQVYLPVPGHTLDNAAEATRAFDGNPATFWSTDHYNSPTFGNLYPGIGLEIELSSSAALRTLTVTSSTTGWSASAYVSSSPISNGQPVSAWGSPASTLSGINGSTTFSLGGRHGRYVLLFITNLGPAEVAQVAELAVH
jgi:hypothetical protein